MPQSLGILHLHQLLPGMRLKQVRNLAVGWSSLRPPCLLVSLFVNKKTIVFLLHWQFLLCIQIRNVDISHSKCIVHCLCLFVHEVGLDVHRNHGNFHGLRFVFPEIQIRIVRYFRILVESYLSSLCSSKMLIQS